MGSDGGPALITILALAVARVLQVCNFCPANSRRSRDSKSRTDDWSGEEEEALRKGSESTSRTDDASCEEYDVFLSFCGPDTCNGFTNCLYNGLRDAGIRVFLDDKEPQVSKVIDGELKAQDNSQIYIPILSKGYAKSSWYLREVAHMVKCTSKSDGKKEILPIFYNLDPDDVKLKTKLYREAMTNHKKKFSSDELKWWENALVEVARIKGWVLKGKG